MLLIGGGNRFRQIPDGRVEERACPHCRVTRTFVECAKTFTVDVWFVDVYKSTERVLVCVECQEDIGMPPPVASVGARATPAASAPSTRERAKSKSVDDQLAALKRKMAEEVPAARATSVTTSGTCVLYDVTALSVAPSLLSDGTRCHQEAERGNVFFAWVAKPPAQLELVLRVGVEIEIAMPAEAKVVTDRLLRVPSGRLRWAPLEAPERAVEIPVPAGNYLVDAKLAPQATGLWAKWTSEPRFTMAVRLRRTAGLEGKGGGIP